MDISGNWRYFFSLFFSFKVKTCLQFPIRINLKFSSNVFYAIYVQCLHKFFSFLHAPVMHSDNLECLFPILRKKLFWDNFWINLYEERKNIIQKTILQSILHPKKSSPKFYKKKEFAIQKSNQQNINQAILSFAFNPNYIIIGHC